MGKGIEFVGIKSLECKFNPINKTYNPRLHIIVANKEMADILVKECSPSVHQNLQVIKDKKPAK